MCDVRTCHVHSEPHSGTSKFDRTNKIYLFMVDSINLFNMFHCVHIVQPHQMKKTLTSVIMLTTAAEKSEGPFLCDIFDVSTKIPCTYIKWNVFKSNWFDMVKPILQAQVYSFI